MQWFRSTACLFVAAAIMSAAGCGGGGTKTQLRALQGSADSGSLDILLDGSTLFSAAFSSPTAYSSVNAGSRHLQIEQVGSTTPIIDENVNFADSTKYTLITTNFLSAITPVLLADDTTAPASGKFKVRLVNDMPTVGSVDVYVVTPGTLPGTVPPTISALSLDGASGYQSLTAGTYDVIVTGAGNVFTYLDTGPVTFGSGQNRTIVVESNLSGYGSVTLADLN